MIQYLNRIHSDIEKTITTMPKIYSEMHINRVWQMAHSGMNNKEICTALGCSMADVAGLYMAASKRYGRPIDEFLNTPDLPVKKKRPPAIYSNKKFW